MSKVLVVDDEADFCRLLETSLSGAGHEVRTAGTGRAAIDVGARFRPDLLVADWLLRGPIHGLYVADTLRAVRPDLRTILITGFLTEDLRGDAERARVFDVIPKPFSLDRFEQAVGHATGAPRDAAHPSPLAIAEIVADGAIRFANAAARDLFTMTHAGRDAASLAALFGPEQGLDLAEAAKKWQAVAPLASLRMQWHVRARAEPDGGWLLVIRDGREQNYETRTLANLLLGLSDAAAPRWPTAQHVLLVDRRSLPRNVAAHSLRAAGCTCHAAENAEAALRLIQRDAEIGVAVVDVSVAEDAPPGDGDLKPLLDKLRDCRPDVIQIVSGESHHRDAAVAAGVVHFLQEPWNVDDLIRAATGRIGPCIECGLPLPLRRPLENETRHHWVCCGCGARYMAVLLDDAPPDLRRHVERAELH